MVDADAVARRLLSLNECLEELKRPEAGDVRELTASPLLRAAVERWLQVAVEACVDIATHTIASHSWTPPASAREAFTILARHGQLPPDLAQRLGNAAGMRNVLVHDYVSVDLERLALAVRVDLNDLREFAGHAKRWMDE